MSDNDDSPAQEQQEQPSSLQNTLKVDSKISEVTVFESSAQIRRVAAVDLPRGEASIVFSDLPEGLDRDTVQVSLRRSPADGGDSDESVPGVSLRGIAFKTDTITIAEEAPTAERTELVERIKKMKGDLAEARANQEAAQERGGFFRACAESALKGERPEDEKSAASSSDLFSDPAKFKQMLEVTETEDAAALAEQRLHEKRIKEIAELLSAAQSQLSSMGGGARTVTKQIVVVVLKVEKAMKGVDVRISYVSSGASWTASYDLRYDVESQDAKLQYNAVIQQHSRECWNDVVLTISTARPTISGRPKDLTPWHMSVIEPITQKSGGFFGGKQRRQNVRFDAHSRAAIALDDEEEDSVDELCCGEAGDIDLSRFEDPQVHEEAKAQEGATAMSFTLPASKTVTNDLKAVRVTLTTVDLKTTALYIARPKLSESVFCQIKATNLSSFALLPGPMMVYSGSQFISKAHLEKVTPGGDFKASLGVDNDILCKRVFAKKRDESAGGLLSKAKIKWHLSTTLKINNRKKAAVDVLLEDQFPVSQHGDIEVNVLKPENAKPEDEHSEAGRKFAEGILQFKEKIPAQTEKKFVVEVSVKCPKDFVMEGL